MTEADDALRYDQGIQACTGCDVLTVSCYQGLPCCLDCYPERKAKYQEQQATTWHAGESTSQEWVS